MVFMTNCNSEFQDDSVLSVQKPSRPLDKAYSTDLPKSGKCKGGMLYLM